MGIIKKIILTFIMSIWIINFSSAFAWWIDHFEIIFSPEKAKTWESIDLTINALDKNDTIVKDYEWTIVIFSETDPEVELPTIFKDNTYTFEASDQWVIKFENAVIFRAEWSQELNVYDLDDDTVLWVWKIQISKWETKPTWDTEIEILSPEEGTTIWDNFITVSGNTQKNHMIKIIVNDKKETKTISNNSWVFEVKVENLDSWVNSIKAQVLDADNNIIWESKEVNLNVDSSLPRLKSIELNPKEVDSESSYEIKVIASDWLSEVNVIINDVIIKLDKDEKNTWVYRKNVYAPSEDWNFKIDVILKDELWHEIKELWAWNLVVKKVELNSAKVEDKVDVQPVEVKKELKVTWLKLVELKSKSILTWDPIEWVEWYKIYKKAEWWNLELITEVKEPKFEIAFSGSEIKYEYFAVKPIWKTASWELYEWDLSEATKIQTWPEIFLLIIFSLFIWGLLIISRKRKA